MVMSYHVYAHCYAQNDRNLSDQSPAARATSSLRMANNKKGGLPPPFVLASCATRSSVHVAHRAAGAALLREHGHLVHVQHAVIGHGARHLHVMAFMSFDRIGIRDSDDFLV